MRWIFPRDAAWRWDDMRAKVRIAGSSAVRREPSFSQTMMTKMLCNGLEELSELVCNQ